MYILKSKYLLTEPDTVIDNGAVLIDDGKIKFAGRFNDIDKQGSCRTIDLGNSAIIPGLINAHTHLELTHLYNCISYNGDFTDWVRQIIIAKEPWTEHEYVSSIQDGITQSLEAGTTTIADTNRNGLALDELKKSKIRKVLFYELIDFNPHSAENTIENYKAEINRIGNDKLLSVGIYPHSPYTVSKELYKRCKRVSEELGIHFATHASETNDEIEFLTRGTGRIMSLLKYRDMLNNWKYPGLRPIEYLNNMGILKNECILVHCNYITEEEIEDISRSGSSIVFCPRSHKFFGHKNHPFRKFIDLGVNVTLGTDSLASNNSLSILDEMKYLYEQHKEVRPQDILYMGTVAGAIAFRMKDKIGRLKSGYEADITAIRLPEERASNVFDGIFSPGSECIFTVVSGSVCYDKYGLNKE